jgi:hypothetical protein
MTGSVRTAADHVDSTLRGRTYAVPFEDVWSAALRLAGGQLRGWRLLQADDDAGRIRASCASVLFRAPRSVEIRIGLDADAQTRVDAEALRSDGRRDLGVCRRRLRQLFRHLDAAVVRAQADRLRRTDGAAPQRDAR